MVLFGFVEYGTVDHVNDKNIKWDRKVVLQA